jgi:hypothetical protein
MGCVHRLDIRAMTTWAFSFQSSVRGDRRGGAASPEWIPRFGTEAISSASRGRRHLFVPGAPCRGFVIMPAYRPKLSQIRSDEGPSRALRIALCVSGELWKLPTHRLQILRERPKRKKSRHAVASFCLEPDWRPDAARSPRSEGDIRRRDYTSARRDGSREKSSPSAILYQLQHRDDRRDLLHL